VSTKSSILCVLLLTGVAAYAQLSMTADQVMTFIRSSIQLHHDDRKIAEYVKKIKLKDKLQDRKVEELQGLGAGPRTLAALRELSNSSTSLPDAPPPVPVAPKPTIPPPDSVEQAEVLHEIIENARNYAKTLPDYMCIQVTRRRVDPTGSENWRLQDTIQEQLSYVEHKESYKVVMYNGRSVANVQHYQLGGSTSSGEFGSIYTEIFAVETATEFDWDHWATLRGRRMYVFAFKVPQSRSKYTIYSGDVHRTITAGYHGLIYADRDSKKVMRYRMECDDIPADFPIKDVKLDVNYDNVEIAGSRYILPLKTEIRARDGKWMTWNEADFHLYQKFGADTTIKFETDPEPIPTDKTEEQPAQPDPKDQKPPVKKQP
jgi:hypothetical protein